MADSIRFILVTLIFKQEGDVWTAECKELGTTAFGDDFDEANEAIHEAIDLHIEGLSEEGELSRFLKEHKVKIFEREPKPTEEVDAGKVPIGAFVNPEVQRLVLA